MQNILELCEGMETQSFAAGEVLVPEGGKTGLIYVLVSGCVEVSRRESPMVTIRQPGAIFGEIALLLDGYHTATVEAVEPTVCRKIEGGRAFLAENPWIALAVAELLASRVKGMIGYLADMKAQYGGREDHLGMVDELLLDLAHRVPKC